MNSEVNLHELARVDQWAARIDPGGDGRSVSATGGIQLIGREELKAKLHRGDDFKLVMTWNEEVYKSKHIPGSIHIFSPEKARELLDPQDEIVVYCTNEICGASIMAYWFLVKNGYRNVRRYAGGLLDWEQVGYEMEGTCSDCLAS